MKPWLFIFSQLWICVSLYAVAPPQHKKSEEEGPVPEKEEPPSPPAAIKIIPYDKRHEYGKHDEVPRLGMPNPSPGIASSGSPSLYSGAPPKPKPAAGALTSNAVTGAYSPPVSVTQFYKDPSDPWAARLVTETGQQLWKLRGNQTVQFQGKTYTASIYADEKSYDGTHRFIPGKGAVAMLLNDKGERVALVPTTVTWDMDGKRVLKLSPNRLAGFTGRGLEVSPPSADGPGEEQKRHADFYASFVSPERNDDASILRTVRTLKGTAILPHPKTHGNASAPGVNPPMRQSFRYSDPDRQSPSPPPKQEPAPPSPDPGAGDFWRTLERWKPETYYNVKDDPPDPEDPYNKAFIYYQKPPEIFEAKQGIGMVSIKDVLVFVDNQGKVVNGATGFFKGGSQVVVDPEKEGKVRIWVRTKEGEVAETTDGRSVQVVVPIKAAPIRPNRN